MRSEIDMRRHGNDVKPALSWPNFHKYFSKVTEFSTYAHSA